jgi:hypothetical protein
MASKADQAEPGLFTILTSVVLGVSLGALLAVMHLISRPVEIVSAFPKEPVPGVRYSLEGVSGSMAGTRWKIKTQRIADKAPGGYSFTDAELNAWAGSTFRKAEVLKDQTPRFALLTGVPNFRIEGERLKIVTANDLIIFGWLVELVIEAEGTFAKEADGWHYVPSELHLGGFPAHKMPILASLLVKRLGTSSFVPAETVGVMASATDIGIASDALVVKMP